MQFDQKVKERFRQLSLQTEEVAKTIKKGTYIDGLDKTKYSKWCTNCLNLFKRSLGEDSEHYQGFKKVYLDEKTWNDFPRLRGIFYAAKSDYEGGYLFNLEDRISADIFSDFLEMAEYLLSLNYKDASAVLIGGVLEDTLRKLCAKHGITLAPNPKIGSMNDELAKNKVYNKLQQKQITAWADIRNNAAHGNYTQYTKADVEEILKGVRNFALQYLT